MSSVACNPDLARQGRVPNICQSSELDEQLKLGLAVQLGLNGTDQINRRALSNLKASKQARSNLKQTLRARACVYEDELKPALFSRREDLGGKTPTLKNRRQARAMLAGAPLFLAQLSVREMINLVHDGDQRALSSINLDSVMSAREFFQAVGKAPLADVLSLCNQTRAETLSEGLRQLENDLDYIQEILVNGGHYAELNPLLHAVLDGFGRRSRYKRFLPDNNSVALDCLRHERKISEKDSDLKCEELQKDKVSEGTSATKVNTRWRSNRTRTRRTGLCYAFQRGTCNLRNCRFSHLCMSCGGEHGSHACTSNLQQRTPLVKAEKSTPPHPRFRRDRAS